MRSGILSIDNPNENDTLIYKEEYAKEAAKKKKSKKIKDRFRTNVGLRRMTHHNIVFLNQNPKKLAFKKNGKRLTNKKSHCYIMKEQEPIWKTKRRTKKMNEKGTL